MRPGVARVEPTPLALTLGQGVRWLLLLLGLFLLPLLVDAVMTPLTKSLRRAAADEREALRKAARAGAPGGRVAWGDQLLDEGRADEAREQYLEAVAAGELEGATRLADLYDRAGRPVLADAWRDRAR